MGTVERGGSGRCPLTHAQFDVVRRMKMKKPPAGKWLPSDRLFPACPGGAGWIRVSPDESRWIQVCPGESWWIWVSLGESG